jgi:catechol 2,3-dioxygenase-like lactoylglutathione lyase family enzyme
MPPKLKKAFGYQGDHLKLPVANLSAAIPFYEQHLGFRVVSRRDAPHKSAILARDAVQIGLSENGGDPTQDGCAFHVEDVAALRAEFQARGLTTELSDLKLETRDNKPWTVFFVVAPDGLCYWFGEPK